MPYNYSAFGLGISSFLKLPMLSSNSANSDISIISGKCPQGLKNPTNTGLRFQATADELLLNVDQCARFHVQNGKTITIEMGPSTPPSREYIKHHLLGSGIAALFHQRNLLAVHASVVAKNGKAFAFLGQSGSGKSSLATALLQRGFRSLTDDLCAIHFDQNLIPHVVPSFPSAKLWPDSLLQLKIAPACLPLVRQGFEKRSLSLEEYFTTTPTPLKKIFLLTGSNCTRANLSPMTELESFTVLVRSIFRNRYLAGDSQQRNVFEKCLQLSKSIPLISTHRGTHGSDIHHLTKTVVKEISECET